MAVSLLDNIKVCSENQKETVRDPIAAIFGCSGLELTKIEKEFFCNTNPFGFILFSRNCGSPKQLSSLIGDLRETTGRNDTPILIDQEGGAVIRMKAPNWRDPPPASIFGELAEKDLAAARGASWINARLIAFELEEVGINVCCAPVLDAANFDEVPIISTRAFSSKPEIVAELGRAACDGFLAGGVMPVIKHLPGYGRATIDSHHALPVINASLAELIKSDFISFSSLSDMPIGMTAHVKYSSLDPRYPGTVSKFIIGEIIRKIINFKGILLTDDLSMNALNGSLEERAFNAISAGCDVALHCSGNLDEMSEIANVVGSLGVKKTEDWRKYKNLSKRDKLNNYSSLIEEFNNLIKFIS